MTTISKQTVSRMTSEEVAMLAKRLEQDDYSNAFEGLQDWHLLRAIAFQRPEMVDMVQPYLYLLDIEAYDEA
ncbi:protein IsiD [Roseofilum casamattae]|uniref:DUF2555 domain-containing protein n=1 Tax=Roseofilum casamattae BLCC-M143 TaxID=3022442 RepID=A0ABT7C180_9CYAN|nr:DUF2555 domain-containing protein [Roseofilum casamattae]MDJ1184446.1 DUF2555 domain-containing protein [Roseofilum casamattae BLCC-M143]